MANRAINPSQSAAGDVAEEPHELGDAASLVGRRSNSDQFLDKRLPRTLTSPAPHLQRQSQRHILDREVLQSTNIVNRFESLTPNRRGVKQLIRHLILLIVFADPYANWGSQGQAYSQAAWLSVMPEFNPFKYNSFPVNGWRQSYLLTNTLQQQITRLAREKRLDRLAPLLTFQSVIDFTVSTRAVVSALYALLPPNGSELVLFDVNRSAKFGQLWGHRTICSKSYANRLSE